LNHPFYRGKLGYGLVDEEVAQQISDAFPPDGSGVQPPQQPDSGLKAKLEAELAAAKQEVDRLQAELSAAEQTLAVAQQATASARAAITQGNENVDKAWKELIESWRAWYRSFFGSPAEREALRRRREQAWDNLYKAMAERREAQARLRVAQTEEIRARDRRNTLAAQLQVAQAKVSELERRLAQLSISSQSRLQGTAHRSEIEQLLQKIQSVTGGLNRGDLPEGVQEVSDLYLSDDSRQGLSSD
jgi:multidrug efflux pump subunit AcrA (membrane-fusion protein)